MVREFLLRLLGFRVWLVERLKSGDLQSTLFWAGVIGFCGGLASVGFRRLLHIVQWLLTGHTGSLVQAASELPLWERLLLPPVGGFLAGLVLVLGTRLAPNQSSTDYMEAIALGDGVIRFRSTLVKSASSLLTISSGGSIGREGPMVQLSAMLASLFGRWIKLTQPKLKLLVACGAAAGIASAYNAPIAGALFVAEIVLGTISMESFGPLVFSSVIATVTVRDLLGANPVYQIPPFYPASVWELGAYVVLGLITGVMSPWFLRLLAWSEWFFARLPVSVPVRLMLGGLLVGVLSVAKPEVWGNGYTVVDSVLHGDWLWYSLLIVLVFKLAATAATVGSGAVGGVFTPTLFVGAVTGSLFGQLIHLAYPAAVPSGYALVAMGCFLSATTHAPIMAILMLFEMTLDYAIVLPLMLACVTAYYVANGLEAKSIYSDSLRRKQGVGSPVPISLLCVADLLKRDPITVRPGASFGEVAEKFAVHTFKYLYVTDADGRFQGVIALQDLKPFLSNEDLARVVIARDLIREEVKPIAADIPLSEALTRFMEHDGERLPVVETEKSGVLIGSISKTDLLLTFALPEK